MSSQKLVNLINIVNLTQSAARRIPDEFRGPSYFGMLDEWIYNTEESESVCPTCQENNLETFYGSELRVFFPFWMILDENTILPNVHPNCRCKLTRTTFVVKEEI